MLELKNLTKIYSTKGGDVKALDDISIKFGETGLVFLLGKSGSGKSTLLNLAGGLDEPTSGEIIVMGKSSKDFTRGDFDSYRNTYVGFVFQEYNVLNEFNVEDNVALALELQGKTHDRDRVRQILEEVDLGELGKRRPNTLSGGQKQRIAIARALVKNPQIIMADEPTGALDSATGRQVFETLKSLSQTRLIIVVSHDREFAELYGDRIVELKDGKIISDVTKVREAAEAVSGRIVRIGEDTISVNSGALDDETFGKIRAFLEGSRGDVIISRGEREIASFRRANRIDESGARERFFDTEEEKLGIKQYDGSAKFIRSRLPAGKAIRIGASSLKLKPFRLVMTVLLSVVSFIMFGLFSTMMLYNERQVLINSFMQSDSEYLTISKKNEVRRHSGDYVFTTSRYARFTPEEVAALGDGAFGTYSADITTISNMYYEGDFGKSYYTPSIMSVAVLPEGHGLRERIIEGKYPTSSDELCVSTYFAECALNHTFYPISKDGEMAKTPKKLHAAGELIGEKIDTDAGIFTICGIFDSGDIPAKFDELKTDDYPDFMLEYEFQRFIGEGLHALALADEAYSVERPSGDVYEDFEYGSRSFSIQSIINGNVTLYDSSAVKVYVPDSPTQLPVLRFDGSAGELKDDELILSLSFLKNYYDEKMNMELALLRDNPPVFDDFDTKEEYEEAIRNHTAEIEKKRNEAEEFSLQCDILSGEYFDGESGKYITSSAAQREKAREYILGVVKAPLTVTLYMRDYNDYEAGDQDIGEYKIVGIYTNLPSGYYEYGYYCSQSFYDNAGVVKYYDEEETKYVPEDGAIFNYVFCPFGGSRAVLTGIIDKLFTVNAETDVFYFLENSLYEEVSSVSELIGEISTIFLIVGIVLAVFASLLLFNFITLSISNKKKEIGILRAVGARGMDVFKIFFAESGIIVGICTLLAVLGTIAVTVILNVMIRTNLGFGVTLFVFGPLSLLIMLAAAAAVAFAATFLPVFLAARKNPVDSIRAL